MKNSLVVACFLPILLSLPTVAATHETGENITSGLQSMRCSLVDGNRCELNGHSYAYQEYANKLAQTEVVITNVIYNTDPNSNVVILEFNTKAQIDNYLDYLANMKNDTITIPKLVDTLRTDLTTVFSKSSDMNLKPHKMSTSQAMDVMNEQWQQWCKDGTFSVLVCSSTKTDLANLKHKVEALNND